MRQRSPTELWAELVSCGMESRSAFRLVQSIDNQRLQEAIDYAKSIPRGKVNSRGGLVIWLVFSTGPIPEPWSEKI